VVLCDPLAKAGARRPTGFLRADALAVYAARVSPRLSDSKGGLVTRRTASDAVMTIVASLRRRLYILERFASPLGPTSTSRWLQASRWRGSKPAQRPPGGLDARGRGPRCRVCGCVGGPSRPVTTITGYRTHRYQGHHRTRGAHHRGPGREQRGAARVGDPVGWRWSTPTSTPGPPVGAEPSMSPAPTSKPTGGPLLSALERARPGSSDPDDNAPGRFIGTFDSSDLSIDQAITMELPQVDLDLSRRELYGCGDTTQVHDDPSLLFVVLDPLENQALALRQVAGHLHVPRRGLLDHADRW
jgi:hypothetical protein